MFITFEGGEGAGKSTQVKLLAEYLRQKGRDVMITREPGGTEGGKKIRELLMDPSMPDWDPMTEYMLLLADRKHHVGTVILPALAQGTWVISDRFQDSSWVYQGWVKGLDLDKMNVIYDLVLESFYPDLTFVLDVPWELAQERIRLRGNSQDRFEREQSDFHQKIREGFLQLSHKCAHRKIVCIRAQDNPQEVHEQIVMQGNFV